MRRKDTWIMWLIVGGAIAYFYAISRNQQSLAPGGMVIPPADTDQYGNPIDYR